MFACTSVPFEHAHGEFLAYLFEAVSGLGTVGLSVGITPKLGLAGKLVMIVIMFVGRVGLLSILSVLSMTGRKEYHYSPERVMIG
jgi:trk system potassium uptake protein TrkH